MEILEISFLSILGVDFWFLFGYNGAQGLEAIKNLVLFACNQAFKAISHKKVTRVTRVTRRL